MLGEKECCISPCTSTLRALIPVKTEDIFVVSDIISDIKRDLNHHQLQPPSIKLIHVAFTRYTGISSSRRGSSRPSPSNYRERLSVLSATKRRKGRERVYGEAFASGVNLEPCGSTFQNVEEIAVGKRTSLYYYQG